jgi:LmbE family N-acetylglucosaminyl deacetylase
MLLAVFAHPDDESFHCGGTLARYAAAGVPITLLCATRGEGGAIADRAAGSAETLPSVREAELRAAARALGVADVRLLDYRDGTLGEVPFPTGVEQVSTILAAARPAVVITFGPEGVSGHADHVMVHRWTKEAFHLARRDESGAPRRLYYCAPPRSWFRAVAERTRALGLPERYNARLEVLGVPDELVTTRVDVAAFAPARLAAIRAHRTQLAADHPFRTLPEPELHELLAMEWFTRAWPPLPPGSPPEDDLFTDGMAGD